MIEFERSSDKRKKAMTNREKALLLGIELFFSFEVY